MMRASVARLLGSAGLAGALLAGSSAVVAQIQPPGPSGPPGPQSSPAAKPGEQFEDWRKVCEPPAGGEPETCYLFQRLVVKESGKNLMAIAIGYLGDKKIPAAVVTVPLGIFLPAGLTLTVPGAEPVRIVVETCLQNQGCRGGAELSEQHLAAMRKATSAEVVLQNANPRRPVKLPVSLKGFTKGLAALKK